MKFLKTFNLLTMLEILGVLSVLVAWLALTNLHIIPQRLLPSPQQVWLALVKESDDILQNFALTIGRAAVGFTVGSAAGISVALTMGWSLVFRSLTEPIVLILRPIPPLALAPFALLWFGLGFASIVSLSTWAVFFTIVIVGIEGLRSIPIIYLRAGQALGASRLDLYRRVVLPALVPNLMGGFRAALVAAFNLTLLQEFRVASGGLGDVIVRGYRYLHSDQLLAGVLCVIFTVFVLDLIFLAFRTRFLSWVD